MQQNDIILHTYIYIVINKLFLFSKYYDFSNKNFYMLSDIYNKQKIGDLFMKKNTSMKIVSVIVFATLLLISLFNPITIGYNTKIRNSGLKDEEKLYNNSLYKYALSDPYSPEINIPEEDRIEALSDTLEETGLLQLEKQKEEPTLTGVLNNAPLDPPWPMYCHDVRHTGRSPYSTADNPGIEQWRFDKNDDEFTGSPVIDDEGIIYIGNTDLFAVYPNGTEKWSIKIEGKIASAPAIDENGILYVGSIWAHPNYLYAIYKNNGTLKWKYRAGDNIESSPAIGEDGTIYFCDCGNWQIKALYPNGTYKWDYKTNFVIYSSPAIGADGTIYCGSHDGNLYALYPNNGTLKWKYHTSNWVGRGPCVADDGTVYFGSWDGHLYACHPNGTLKWKKGVKFSTTPVIGQDGTIYGGLYYLYAINPEDGSIKWSFDPGEDRTIRGGNPCISSEGIIIFGTHNGEYDGGELIAVNPDGTERWRIMLASDWIMSAPAIGEDGTVYVGSYNNKYQSGSWGYLHAIGKLDGDAPSAPKINGPKIVFDGIEYKYKFKSTSPVGRDIYYWIQWDYFTDYRWMGPYKSGETVTITYEWPDAGKWTVRAVAKDTENLWSQWTILNPKSKAATYDSFSYNLLERFPIFSKILSILI
jgi:outer membrane protein assembly factor BamB